MNLLIASCCGDRLMLKPRRFADATAQNPPGAEDLRAAETTGTGTEEAEAEARSSGASFTHGETVGVVSYLVWLVVSMIYSGYQWLLLGEICIGVKTTNQS